MIIKDNVWKFDEDYTQWTTEDLRNWLNLICSKIDILYGPIITELQLNGYDFNKNKLGNIKYLTNMYTLNMKMIHSIQFANVVNNRIEVKINKFVYTLYTILYISYSLCSIHVYTYIHCILHMLFTMFKNAVLICIHIKYPLFTRVFVTLYLCVHIKYTINNVSK